jgi:hypothetical protein
MNIGTNLPGFSAEDSLYISTTHYNVSTEMVATNVKVQPQLRPWPKPPGSCIPNCVCVSPIDCPCCTSMGWPWPVPEEPTWPLGQGAMDISGRNNNVINLKRRIME